MIKNILLALFICLSVSMYAQQNIDYTNVPLEKDADYKSAEPMILSAANYMLSNPVSADDIKRVYAVQFILAWMGGTPDYTFSLASFDKIDKKSINQQAIYIASLAKYTLENKSETEDKKQIELGAWKLLLDYCSNSNNNIQGNKQLSKMMSAYAKGELAKELD